MIIELFGPPGAGKTTLARALVEQLRQRGHYPKLMLSYRPNEQSVGAEKARARGQTTAAAHRLMRPLVEMASVLGPRPAGSGQTEAVAKLISILPQKSIIASLRMRQYLLRLARSWHEATRSDIAVFDQGFVQAVYSLAAPGRTADKELLARALMSIPGADVLVRIDTPHRMLEIRLAERWRLQGKIERFLEVDPKANLASAPIIDTLHDILREQGRSVARVGSVGQLSLREAVRTIESQIMARINADQAGGAIAARAGEAAAPIRVRAEHRVNAPPAMTDADAFAVPASPGRAVG